MWVGPSYFFGPSMKDLRALDEIEDLDEYEEAIENLAESVKPRLAIENIYSASAASGTIVLVLVCAITFVVGTKLLALSFDTNILAAVAISSVASIACFACTFWWLVNRSPRAPTKKESVSHGVVV